MNSLKDLYITKDELREIYGLDMEDFAVDETTIDIIINLCVGKAITTIYKLNDNITSDKDIYDLIVNNGKELSFKKLQYQVIYNYLYISSNDPINDSIFDIIAYELKLCKINGIQKGVNVK